MNRREFFGSITTLAAIAVIPTPAPVNTRMILYGAPGVGKTYIQYFNVEV